MYTEINWTYTIWQDGRLARCGSFTTVDLSFPMIRMEQLGEQYAPCKIQVRSSIGEIREKSFE